MAYEQDDNKIKRLREAITYSRKQLAIFRTHRMDAIKQYVGANYSDDGADDKVPINLLFLAVTIYVRQLAANAPQMLCGTDHRELKSRAAKLELAANHLMNEIRYGKTLKRIALNSLFGIGIMKTGMCVGGSVEVEGVTHDIGQPFADSVDFDDWVHDTTAKNFEECQFYGNRYSLPLEYIKNSDLFDETERNKLKGTPKSSTNEGGDERLDKMSQGDQANCSEYMEMVELWDIFLPQENLVITLQLDGTENVPLRVVEWEGPECGPYQFLYYSEVPNNIMPVAPAAQWMDLHELANILYRKLGRQAYDQKTVVFATAGAEEDAKRMVKAGDGDVIKGDNPQGIKEYKFNGVDQPGFAFALSVMDKFSYFAGNLDSLGGLSPQAETLGQDQLLAQNSSKTVAEMQDAMKQFAKDGIKSLCWHLWYDPMIDLPLVKRIPNSDVTVPTRFTAEDREGDFLDYNIDIEPFSMQDSSPGAKLQTLNNFLQGIALPMMPLMQQSGAQLNIEAIMKTYSKLTNMHEIMDFVIFSGPPQTAPDEGPVVPPTGVAKSPVTKRTYERINRPGATRGGKDNAMMQSLLGKGLQDSQREAMGRAAV